MSQKPSMNFLTRVYSVTVASLVLLVAAPAPVAQAAVLHFHTFLSGLLEIPANASPGTGTGDVYFDTVAHTLKVDLSWSGLLAGTTVAHIHAPATAAQIVSAVPFAGTWGVATQPGTLTGFPSGLTSGSYSGAPYSSLLVGSYTAGFLGANGGTAALAEAALLTYLHTGKAYLNIHSTAFPGGEIKGYLVPIPEPETYAMLLAGLGLLGFVARRRKQATAA